MKSIYDHSGYIQAGKIWDCVYLDSASLHDLRVSVSKNVYKVRAKILLQTLWGKRGVWDQKTSLAYIKVQTTIEFLLLMESQNLRLTQKYDTSNFLAIVQSHTKYRGIKWRKWLFLINNFKITCLLVSKLAKKFDSIKCYFFHPLSCVGVLRFQAKSGQKILFRTKKRFSQSHLE